MKSPTIAKTERRVSISVLPGTIRSGIKRILKLRDEKNGKNEG